MKHKLGITLLLATTLSIGAYAMAGPNMQPGQWKMTGQMEMPGMPMKIPAVTFHQCITKKDMVPRSKQSQECKMLNHTTEGNTVKWKMQCNNKQGGPSTMEGEVTYSGKSMKGTVKIMNGGSQMLQRISGTWVGQCQK